MVRQGGKKVRESRLEANEGSGEGEGRRDGFMYGEVELSEGPVLGGRIVSGEREKQKWIDFDNAEHIQGA